MSYFYLCVNGDDYDEDHLDGIEAKAQPGFRFMSQCREWTDENMIKVMCEYSKQHPGVLFSVRWYVCQEENPDGDDDKTRYLGPIDFEAACQYEARRDFMDGQYQDWTVTVTVTCNGAFKLP